MKIIKYNKFIKIYFSILSILNSILAVFLIAFNTYLLLVEENIVKSILNDTFFYVISYCLIFFGGYCLYITFKFFRKKSVEILKYINNIFFIFNLFFISQILQYLVDLYQSKAIYYPLLITILFSILIYIINFNLIKKIHGVAPRQLIENKENTVIKQVK